MNPPEPNAKARETARRFRAERAATVPTRRTVREAARVGADDYRHGMSSRDNGHYSHPLLIFAYRQGYYEGGAWSESLTAPVMGSEVIKRYRTYVEEGGEEREAAHAAKIMTDATAIAWPKVRCNPYGWPRFEGETNREFADRIVRDYRRRKAAREECHEEGV